MPLKYEEILDEFPTMKLSYENIIHKKVYNLDYVTAIPEGKKCFAWFTTYNNQNVCFIMDLAFFNNNNNYKIIDIKIMNCCFSTELSYGTILYGTKFYKGNLFFTIENILYYKGENVASFQWGKKLNIINELMSRYIKQQSYNNSFIVFGLPLIKNNLEELLKDVENIKYKIDKIQFILFNKANVLLYVPYRNINYFLQSEPPIKVESFKQIAHPLQVSPLQVSPLQVSPLQVPQLQVPPPILSVPQLQVPQLQVPQLQVPQPILCVSQNLTHKSLVKNDYKHITKREIVFKIKPDVQNDIYHLYCDENDNDIFYDIAYIQDYKKSVFMNKLFRKIKENDNLDALEESDDETEFEDDREDKFVYLDKSYKMYCVYNNKFKKWVPTTIADENVKLINKRELKDLFIIGNNKQ